MNYKITKSAYKEILETVGMKQPESGGYLFGPSSDNNISHFLFDNYASTTGASFTPNSDVATQKVCDFEIKTGMVFKGVFHSHPGNLNHPSSGDLSAVKNYFRVNPSLKYFIMPIGTFSKGSFSINWYIVMNNNELKYEKLDVSITKDLEYSNNNETDLTDVLSDYESYIEDDLIECSANETYLIKLQYVNIILSIPQGFPAFCPLVTFLPLNNEFNPFQRTINNWNSTQYITVLKEYLKLCSEKDINFFINESLNNNETISQDNDLSSFNIEISKRINTDAWNVLNKKKAVIFGCGSGGSYLAEIMTRSGVGTIVLVDNDHVEISNLTRSMFNTDNIGIDKVEALNRRLKKIRPDVNIIPIPKNVLDIDDFSDVIESSDLILALTDTPKAQARINRWAYHCNIPAIYAGLYERAQGGEVCVVLPNENHSCYQCSLGNARDINDQLDESEKLKNFKSIDYTSGTLTAEPGLISDIHFVDSIVSKISLAILLNNFSDEDFKLNELYSCVVKNPVIFTSMVPNYWVFPKILGNQCSIGGYQPSHNSIWLPVEKNDECSICGKREYRVSPFDQENVRIKLPKNITNS